MAARKRKMPKCTRWKRGHRWEALRHKTGGVTFWRCSGCGLCAFKKMGESGDG